SAAALMAVLLSTAASPLAVQARGGGGGGCRGRRGGRGRGGGGSAGTLSFSIEARRDSLEKGIYLLGEILRQPAFPAEEFEQMRLRSASMIAQMESDPATLSSELLSRTLSQYPKGDVRYSMSMAERKEELESVTLEQVQNVYQKQLSAAHAEIAIVGDFEVESAMSAVREILRDWKSETAWQEVSRDARADVKPLKQDIVTPDKANAVFLAGLSFAMNDDHPDAAALQLGNFILGGGTLSSRLGDRIRQNEGLSYGVNSSVSIPSTGNDARFGINAITNPANMNAVEKAAMEELERFLKDGPSAKELADAQTAWLESRKVSRTSDGAIAGQLVSNLHLSRTFARDAEEDRRIAELTPELVRDAFRRHIDPAKLIVIRAGDFR
ncbi:MAG TPA: insulinase family protein, partial [Planctomycetaceae bacterium]|nr:insulinase family protein [Planctomycetaceae bacterium]